MLNKLAYEYIKSGLSINTHIGCSLNCVYCVLDSLKGFPTKPTRIAQPEELVKKLITGDMFVNGLSPLYVNNRTDPFLPEVIDDTYRVLSLLQSHSIKSPVLLITKLSPDERIESFFEHLNILLLYTFTNLQGMDYNSCEEINRKNIEQIKRYIPQRNRFHYYRPIIPGHNDNASVFVDALNKTDFIFKTTVIGGIRIVKNNSFVNKSFHHSSDHKYFEDSLFRQFSRIAQEHGVNIVRHTSCAIGLFMEQPCKLKYWSKSSHCSGLCANIDVCTKQCIPFDSRLHDVITRYTNAKTVIRGGTVIFSDPVSQELIAFLKSSFGVSIEADEILLSPSEEMLL